MLENNMRCFTLNACFGPVLCRRMTGLPCQLVRLMQHRHATTVKLIWVKPSMLASSVSPATTAPTPAGVPV